MSWIDEAADNYFLKMLYPMASPLLDAVRLHEVKLHQDGPVVSLRFDLNEYPAQPPAKWQAVKSNTVQVCLDGIGVREFAMRGWALNNVGRLVVKKGGSGIIVEFDADECHITAAFDHLRVASVTAYWDEARENT